MNRTDVAVIGGGAAGLCAAVNVKQNAPHLRVTVLEQLDRVGKKLSLTGNGRCNISNLNTSPHYFHSEDPQFFLSAIKEYTCGKTARFFRAIGIEFTADEKGRVYPYSFQASSVVDALRFAAEQVGVEIQTNCTVEGLKPLKNGFLLTTGEIALEASAVLVATGLYASGDKVGSNGKMFRQLKEMGYSAKPVTPALVQLKTETESVRALKGVKVNAKASLYKNNAVQRTEYGEVLFCDYGLSGPPILQLSRPVEREKGSFFVSLDLMPEYLPEQIEEKLQERRTNLKARPVGEFLTGFLQKRVGQTLLKAAGLRLSDDVSAVDAAAVKKLVKLIKDWRFQVTGTTGFLHAQVTAGGLSTDQFDRETMMSRRHAGLFAAGEILDVDGDCGGYNLQWAWSSGMVAAEGIIAFLEGRK